MAKIKEETLRLSECTMDYISFGNGEKPLIMIPGLSLRRVKGSGRGVALSYRIFAKDYRVYMFDTRNECDESCSITQMADDLYEAMCALRIEQADLLGVGQADVVHQAQTHSGFVHDDFLPLLFADVMIPYLSGIVQCASGRRFVKQYSSLSLRY